MKKLLVIITCHVLVVIASAQSVAVSTDGTVADPSAMFDVKSTSKGLLVPRMTKTQRSAIASPAVGLLVFQTGPDSIGFHYYSGGQWLWLDPFVSNTWKNTGNTGTDTAVNFMGTTDNMPIRFKQNNQQLAQWDLNRGNYFLGKRAGMLKSSQMGHSIAIGDSALANIGDELSPAASNFNIAVGYKALKNHRRQIGNVAIGAFSMMSFEDEPTGGHGSVSIGYAAMNTIRSGVSNVGIGSFALASDSIGSGNTAVGYQTLALKLKGNMSTAHGFMAGSNLRVSNDNSFFGANANTTMDSLVNASAIGARAIVDTSNAMVLGSIASVNGATNNTNVAIGTTKPKGALHVSRGSSGFTTALPSTRTLIVEDNTSSYIQLLHPTANESGILAGNAVTSIKSGIVFGADSSISLRTGGNSTKVLIDNSGMVGVGVTPKSKMDVASFGSSIRVAITSPIILTEFDHTLVIDNFASGTILLFLPTAASAPRREYTIVNQSNALVSTTVGYQDFTGATITDLPTRNSITIQSTGTAWVRTR